jgi:hypothetical protein
MCGAMDFGDAVLVRAPEMTRQINALHSGPVLLMNSRGMFSKKKKGNGYKHL